jgi:hypothetical protein
VPLRELLGDEVLDLLLERSRDGVGGLRLTGQGSMLGQLVKQAKPAYLAVGSETDGEKHVLGI